MNILADEQIPGVSDRLADLGNVRTFVGRELTPDVQFELLTLRSCSCEVPLR